MRRYSITVVLFLVRCPSPPSRGRPSVAKQKSVANSLFLRTATHHRQAALHDFGLSTKGLATKNRTSKKGKSGGGLLSQRHVRQRQTRRCKLRLNLATANSTTETMADASAPLPDFFASDDESDAGENAPVEVVSSEPELAGPSIPSSQASNEDPATGSPLFLPDEEDANYGDAPVEWFRFMSVRPDTNLVGDVDMSDVFGIHQEGGSKSAIRRKSEEVLQPNKRRKLSPPSDFDFKSAFFGSIVVPNAWSTVKGKGYVKNGDPILVEWDKLKQEDDPPRKSDKKKPPQKKGKQLTLTALMKPRQENFKKKKQNDIVRLTNKGGFGELAQLFISH